jgi:hypothetical protein
MPDWLITLLKELGVITGDETPEDQQAKITAALNKLKPAAEGEGEAPPEMVAANSRIKSLQEQIITARTDALIASGRLVVPLANQYKAAARAAGNEAEFAAIITDLEAKAKMPGPKTEAALKNAAPGNAAAQQALNNASDDAKIAARARELRAKGTPADAAYRQAVTEAGKA